MEKIRPCKIIIFLLFLCNLSASNNTLDFADYLFNKGYYYRAITEYERFLFFNKNSTIKDYVLFKIGVSYFYGGEYQTAIQNFKNFIYNYKDSKYLVRAIDFLGKSYCKLEKFNEGITTLKRIKEDLKKENSKEFLNLWIGKLYFYSFKWNNAVETWSKIDVPELKETTQKWIEYCNKAKKLPMKSPFVAGILSGIIPGLGQLYNGDIGDGITALLVNSIFFYLTYGGYKDNDYVRVLIFGIMSIGWYGGNIKGAIDGAKRYNYFTKKKFTSTVNLEINFIPNQF